MSFAPVQGARVRLEPKWTGKQAGNNNLDSGWVSWNSESIHTFEPKHSTLGNERMTHHAGYLFSRAAEEDERRNTRVHTLQLRKSDETSYPRENLVKLLQYQENVKQSQVARAFLCLQRLQRLCTVLRACTVNGREKCDSPFQCTTTSLGTAPYLARRVLPKSRCLPVTQLALFSSTKRADVAVLSDGQCVMLTRRYRNEALVLVLRAGLSES